MTVSYDTFTEAFLSKITEYRFCRLSEQNRQSIVDGYLRMACSKFGEICKQVANGNSELRQFDMGDMSDNQLDEVIDIVSDGMLVQWLKPYTYKQENLENMMNTTDLSSYSPAELLKQVVNAYTLCRKEFGAKMKEYSYRHGNLSDLHL